MGPKYLLMRTLGTRSCLQIAVFPYTSSAQWWTKPCILQCGVDPVSALKPELKWLNHWGVASRYSVGAHSAWSATKLRNVTEATYWSQKVNVQIHLNASHNPILSYCSVPAPWVRMVYKSRESVFWRKAMQTWSGQSCLKQLLHASSFVGLIVIWPSLCYTQSAFSKNWDHWNISFNFMLFDLSMKSFFQSTKCNLHMESQGQCHATMTQNSSVSKRRMWRCTTSTAHSACK